MTILAPSWPPATAQAVEAKGPLSPYLLPYKQEVTGSSPVPPTIFQRLARPRRSRRAENRLASPGFWPPAGPQGQRHARAAASPGPQHPPTPPRASERVFRLRERAP